jgi:Zn-dependent peptidase ImmA (M78 family)
MLGDLWQRGIPVIPLEILPAPSFQAIVCIVEGRPVILIGYKHDEPGRVAFLIAHEAGHIAGGDCTPHQPVVDEEEEILDDDDIERRADLYARRVLVGKDSIPIPDDGEFRQLAKDSAQLERETGADAGAIISAWAARTHEYGKATMALKALYRSSGARQLIRRHFNSNVDLEAATESDRNLLRCVFGESELHETLG